jgi:hypothetical protein
MIVIPSYKASIYASMPTAVALRTYPNVFYVFWDTETVLNRYDSTDSAVTTTARGWFFR